MHIPDGYIPLWQCLIYGIIAIVAVAYSLRWSARNLTERNIPLFAVLAAGIFAVMSFNVPIPWGTSGHMVGAALVAIVFASPWAAILLISIVLLLQAFIFGDGGITALGANILNMGILGGFVGYYTFKALVKYNKPIAIFLAGWLSIFLAAILCAIELALAGKFPINLGLTFMGLFHAVIGIIEGVLTLIVILAIERIRPDLIVWKKAPEEAATE